MTLFVLLLIALALSMDAFAVSLCKGLSMDRVSFKKALIVGLWFGAFQAAMPLIGYLLGARFADQIEALDHWLALVLLSIIGGKMIKEALSKSNGKNDDEASLKFKDMLPLAVATSIDALAIGISFAFLNVNLAPAVTLIGMITLALSMLGVKIGNVFGIKFKSKAELAGGVILILIGVKIVLEHTGIL